MICTRHRTWCGITRSVPIWPPSSTPRRARWRARSGGAPAAEPRTARTSRATTRSCGPTISIRPTATRGCWRVVCGTWPRGSGIWRPMRRRSRRGSTPPGSGRPSGIRARIWRSSARPSISFICSTATRTRPRLIRFRRWSSPTRPRPRARARSSWARPRPGCRRRCPMICAASPPRSGRRPTRSAARPRRCPAGWRTSGPSASGVSWRATRSWWGSTITSRRMTTTARARTWWRRISRRPAGRA